MKTVQEKEEGVMGAGGGSGGSSGFGSKGLPKKKKDLKAGPQMRKTSIAAKKRQETAAAATAAKDGKTKDVKRRRDHAVAITPATNPPQKSKESKSKREKPTAGSDQKKIRRSVPEAKKRKAVVNGAAREEKRRKDETTSKDGNVAGGAVASNGWGFGTEVLTCLPRRVASLNAMAKVHIMYENETNRSTAHTAANSTANNQSTVTNHTALPDVPPPASSGSSQPTTEVDTDSDVTIEAVSTNNGHSSPRVDRMIMAGQGVGRCRRMASLNAQAILSASLCHDEKRPKKKDPPPPPPSVTPTASGSGVIKIEDTEDDEKTTTVEEEEIVQIVQTTKIRRRKMKTSKSTASAATQSRNTAKSKIVAQKIENGDDEGDEVVIDLAAGRSAQNAVEEVKVDQAATSATVNQAQQVTRTFTYTSSNAGATTRGVNAVSMANHSIVNPSPPVSQPAPMVLSQQPNVPIQNQASFSYATTINAQTPHGQTQMQGGTVFMTNVNAGYAALVGSPHFTVQSGMPPPSFGIPTAYYQVQPLIHKPIAFHPNGALIGGQNAALSSNQAGTPPVQGRAPARNIVVQVPPRKPCALKPCYGVKTADGERSVSTVSFQAGTNGLASNARVPTDLNLSAAVGTSGTSSASSNGRRGKMMQGPSVSAPGLGSAVAKCERTTDKERKSGLSTGMKSDLLLTKLNNTGSGKRKFSHGWSWLGEPFLKRVFTNIEQQGLRAQTRVCYHAMQHEEGDVIRPRDCVLLKSGPRVIDLPFVAKVGSLWQTPEGEMMISLLWYCRPEHTEQGRRSCHMEDEIFASKHCDANSVACIDDKCYVLSFAEYCRYRAKVKLLEEGIRSRVAPIVPPWRPDPRQERLPDPGRVSADLVFFCRKVYDYRQKRILKNPVVQLPTKDGDDG